VLKALAAVRGADGMSRDFLASTKALSSDYERAEILIAMLSRGLEPSARDAFVGAAESLRSRYDQDRVLAALVRSERR